MDTHTHTHTSTHIHTCMHTNVTSQTKSISRNQVHASLWLARTWFLENRASTLCSTIIKQGTIQQCNYSGAKLHCLKFLFCYLNTYLLRYISNMYLIIHVCNTKTYIAETETLIIWNYFIADLAIIKISDCVLLLFESIIVT